jgi:hypothetical protein
MKDEGKHKVKMEVEVRRYTPIILALRRLRQEDSDQPGL